MNGHCHCYRNDVELWGQRVHPSCSCLPASYKNIDPVVCRHLISRLCLSTRNPNDFFSARSCHLFKLERCDVSRCKIHIEAIRYTKTESVAEAKRHLEVWFLEGGFSEGQQRA